MLVNSIAPARLGDLLRAYLMGEQQRHSKAYVLGTVVVEKLLDTFFLLVSVALLLPQMVFPDWAAEPSLITAVILAGLILAGGLVLWKRAPVLRWLERLGGVLPVRMRAWALRQTAHLADSLECLRGPRRLALILAGSAVVWGLGVLTNLLVFWAMRLNVSAWAAVFLLVVLQVGVAVPSSPGRIGVFHYLTLLALSVFGVAQETALGVGLLLHLAVYVPVFAFGVWGIWSEKLTWGGLLRLAGREARP
jgi:glycosyltransferase 2 family protein